ncbi:ras family-domain-containing protein [Zopfochytrium polystomum]|nr:ras family-domain-containing protein [Zopfochytrium polystomum]
MLVDSGTSLTEELDFIVVGSGGVGKSCLTVRFLKDEFTEDYDPTIEETYRKNILVDNITSTCNITDTAGQHDYTALRDQHLTSGQGFLLVFAVNEKGTFEEMKEIRERIVRVKDTKRVPIVICANKSDLPPEQHEVDMKAVQAYAKSLKVPLFATSAKENQNVLESFHELIREMRKAHGRAGGAGGSGGGGKDGAGAGAKGGSRDALAAAAAAAGGAGTGKGSSGKKKSGGGCAVL